MLCLQTAKWAGGQCRASGSGCSADPGGLRWFSHPKQMRVYSLVSSGMCAHKYTVLLCVFVCLSVCVCNWRPVQVLDVQNHKRLDYTLQPALYLLFLPTVARIHGASRKPSSSYTGVTKLPPYPPSWRQAVTQSSPVRSMGFEPIWRTGGTVKIFLNQLFPRDFFNGKKWSSHPEASSNEECSKILGTVVLVL